MIHLFDLTGEGRLIARTFPDALLLTHRQEPPKFFTRIGPHDSYDGPVLMELVRGRRETWMYGLALLQPFLREPRSLAQVIDFFESGAEHTRSTKRKTLGQSLLPWKPMLGEMAYAVGGPDLEERHPFIIHDLSGLPLEFARSWFSIWVHREFLKGLVGKPSNVLQRALVILQGDAMFGKEFAETTGSAAFSLTKRMLMLQKFGWGIIMLAQQPSELDQVLRNACAIPLCFS
jgi:hypothetical protein